MSGNRILFISGRGRPLLHFGIVGFFLTGNPKELTMLMVLALQGMFLPTDVVKEDLGIDLRTENGRKQFCKSSLTIENMYTSRLGYISPIWSISKFRVFNLFSRKNN